MMPMKLWAQEPYAVLSENNTVLTFYYDEKKAERNGMSVGPFNSEEERGWHEKKNSISSVVIDDSFSNFSTLSSTAYWFCDLTSLSSFKGLELLNTTNVVSMASMFYNVIRRTTIDISKFNTSKVENMDRMFYNCYNLITIYVGSEWNTASVTSGYEMFAGCSSLAGSTGTRYNDNHTDYTYAKIDGGTSNPGYLTDKDRAVPTNICPDNHHPHRIDLGLPSGTQWACCNIGADNPMTFGNYYAWGETEVKETYTWANYIHCDGTGGSCHNIGSDISGTEYDVAHVKWKSNYMMPTEEDIKELIDNCTRTSVIYEGIYYTGPSGNSIFVPSRGYGWVDKDGGAHGNYWTSTLSNNDSIAMNWFVWESVYPAEWNDDGRNSGFYVRPVAKGEPHDPESYAVLSENNTVLTFYYDDQKEARGGMSVGPFNSDYEIGWHNMHSKITSVVFDESFANCTSITSTARWFQEFVNLSSVSGINNLHTDNVTSMYSMFKRCELLTNLDLSGFNTANVTDMSYMFYGCYKLVTLNVSSFNTSNVTNMRNMFYNCSHLTNLDVSSFNTANVTTMCQMFSICSGLTSLDVSGFNTSKVTEMSSMFDVCSSLTALNIDNFDMSNVENMEGMFQFCSGLTSLDLSHLNTEKVKYMTKLFQGCTKLTNINFGNMNTSAVTSMSGMFKDCSSITSLDLSFMDTKSLTGTDNMFSGCSALQSINLSGFHTNYVSTTYEMFKGCSGLIELDLSSFSFEGSIYSMFDMFRDCTSLTTIYASSKWNPSEVQYGYGMFANCTNLVGGAGTTYDVNHTDYTYAHIDGGENNPGYFTDKNAPMIDDNIIQFADANVKAICVKNWDTDGDGELSKAEAENVISLDNAFTGNENITSFDEFQYFVGVTALGSREFGGCYNLASIILPPNLKSLGAESLNNNKIDDLTIPASVTSIESSALYSNYKNIFVEEGNAYFSSIDGVLFNKDITKIVTYPERKEAESYEIPNTVATIGRCAFYSSELKSVTIPYGVKTIEGSAFRYCENLESIDIPSSVETIGSDNFEFATSLTTATIPGSVVSIGTGVFSSCQNLQEIIVDAYNQYYTSVDGVLYTKDKTHLVTYPAGKPDENVVIPNFVTSIGQCGVYGCNNIKSVVIPKRVESIGWFAFVNCANLNSVTTYRKKPLELTKTFDDRAQQNGTLYVPYGTKELYQAADEWNVFQNIEELDPSADPAITISLVNNGDMEGEDNGNFFVRTNYSSGNEEPVQAAISNGVGMNGSRGIKVEATPMVAVSWENQFWVRLNQPISEGTLYRVSFDYRADKEAMINVEAHEEPSAYINWGFFGNDLGFTDSWSHFEYEGTMSSLNSKDEFPFQSLTFTFNNNFEAANNYYFDNFKFEAMMEDQCPKPTFKQKGNEISILSPFDAKIYYTLDGSTPTTSSQVYVGSLKLTENAEINAIAVVEGYEASPVATCKFVHPQFDSNGVLAVTGRTRLSDALEAIGGREEVAKTITAILWEGNYAVYNTDLQGLDNPNMLIYVNSESLAPQNRDNVIIGDFAKNIVLTDVNEGNGNFYCPRTFKAEMISYTHEYRQQTEIGVARGWETIALPFTVQTIMHEKQGMIAPFGNTSSGKHFWLREMTPQGLGQATVISANMPYLISMPNNSVAYPAEFNLNGRVTFSSQDVDVVVTDIFPAYMQSEGSGMLMFAPCFQTLEPRQDAYALNVGEQRGQYLEGSVFESNYRAIRPFEAFTIHEGNSPAPQFISINDMNGGITDIGASLVNSEEANSEKWYDLNGRRLQQKPTQKGVYLNNGRKMVVR